MVLLDVEWYFWKLPAFINVYETYSHLKNFQKFQNRVFCRFWAFFGIFSFKFGKSEETEISGGLLNGYLEVPGSETCFRAYTSLVLTKCKISWKPLIFLLGLVFELYIEKNVKIDKIQIFKTTVLFLLLFLKQQVLFFSRGDLMDSQNVPQKKSKDLLQRLRSYDPIWIEFKSSIMTKRDLIS